jgi:hypothetical protein
MTDTVPRVSTTPQSRKRDSSTGVATENEKVTTIQVCLSTRQWLDQIREEQGCGSYDDAIVFLVKERQKHLGSGFGRFPDLEEYICNGED